LKSTAKKVILGQNLFSLYLYALKAS